MTNIYALYDPRIPDLPFYVGKGLVERAKSHWKAFQRKGGVMNAALHRWFESLKRDGVAPIWQFLEENVANWQEAEKDWIAAARRVNGQLCNVADGGNEFPANNPRCPREISSRTMKRTHQKYPNMSSEVGKRVHQEQPDLAKRMGQAGIKGLREKYSLEIRQQWSSIAGKKNAAKPGFLRRIRLIGLHNRWHRNRGTLKEGCEFCKESVKCT